MSWRVDALTRQHTLSASSHLEHEPGNMHTQMHICDDDNDKGIYDNDDYDAQKYHLMRSSERVVEKKAHSRNMVFCCI